MNKWAEFCKNLEGEYNKSDSDNVIEIILLDEWENDLRKAICEEKVGGTINSMEAQVGRTIDGNEFIRFFNES